MKKLIVIVLSCVSFINVYADVETYERTDEFLRVHESIEVTPHNKDDILNTPAVNEKEKIYDFADLLTDEEELKLYNQTYEFINNYKMDLVVVTINKNYTTVQEYADNFYDYNYFGINDTFDGVLLLIDMDNREISISTNGRAILMYSNYRIEKTLDDMYFYIQNEDYFDTFKSGIDKLDSYAKEGIPEENKNSYINEYGEFIFVPVKTFPLLVFLIISAVVATIILLIFINKNRLVKKAYEAKEYINKDKCQVTKLQDRLISSNTTKVRINNDTSSSGSRSHRSSSGRFHGGGSRRF